jgi:flagellar basal body rod protein FlgC
MKQGFIIIILFMSTMPVFALKSQKCGEMKSEQIRLAMLGSNLSNINTTRTPEGGPYRPFLIKTCSYGVCDVTRGSASIMKYQPGHPDADDNGYVSYPNINKNSEYTAFNLTAAKLRLIGMKNSCTIEVVDNGTSVLLKYKPLGSEVKEDIFNFNKEQKVVSWMRTDHKGQTSTVNFSSFGDVVSYQ